MYGTQLRLLWLVMFNYTGSTLLKQGKQFIPE